MKIYFEEFRTKSQNPKAMMLLGFDFYILLSQKLLIILNQHRHRILNKFFERLQE